MTPPRGPRAQPCAARGHQRLKSAMCELELDLRSYWRRSGIEGDAAVTAWRWLSALLDPALACVVLHRLAHWAWVRDVPLLPRLLAGGNRVLFKAVISPASCVAGGWSVRHPAGLHFHAIAGSDLTLLACASCTADDVPVGTDLARAPTLGSRVQLGANSAVVGPVRVGDDVVIGFRVVVTTDIADHAKVVSDASRVRVIDGARAAAGEDKSAQGSSARRR